MQSAAAIPGGTLGLNDADYGNELTWCSVTIDLIELRPVLFLRHFSDKWHEPVAGLFYTESC